MELYLLRHGIAEIRRAGRPDEARKLTPEGRNKLRLVLDRARQAAVKPTLILTSPYARALETAQIAAEVLGYTGKLVPTDALLPSSSPETVWREIQGRPDENAILLAGHEPLLSQTAAWLLGARAGFLDLKKGALLRVEVEQFDKQPRGVLQWLLTPKLAGRPKHGEG